MKADGRLIAIDHHRNGICGAPFSVLIIKDEGREMLVVRFDKEYDEAAGNVLCAAFDMAELKEGNIGFFENSWRGDYYSKIVDPIIDSTEYEEHQWYKRQQERDKSTA